MGYSVVIVVGIFSLHVGYSAVPIVVITLNVGYSVILIVVICLCTWAIQLYLLLFL